MREYRNYGMGAGGSVLIRFGYVAMSMKLENCSPSKNLTLKSFNQLFEKDGGAALAKLNRIAQENLSNTLRLLKNNKANGVMLYRFSSKLIPLATHPNLQEWPYLSILEPFFRELGDYVRLNNFRVSFHPDHYTLINSPKEEVLQSSLIDLQHHHDMLEAMGLGSEAKLVIHVGGAYKDKEDSLQRFLHNWPKVPTAIQQRLTLENDDKTYTVTEVLELCEELQIPMVLDLHHFKCNRKGNEDISALFPRIAATWQGTGLNPKIHISSPKNEKDFRSHHDFVNPLDLLPFLQCIEGLGLDLDVMVEAKQKDTAMFKLVDDLADMGIKKNSAAELEI